MQRMTATEYQAYLNKPKRHKYGAQKTIVDGITFASKAEADYYSELLILKRTGQVSEIKLQPRYILQEHPKIEYVADFLITWKDGKQEVIDVKGFSTAAFRLKSKLFTAKYPYLPLVIIKNGERIV